MTIVRSILATARNGVIGFRNDLPWPKSEQDMEYFRASTSGSPVIMGGNTWRSLGKPLSKRLNLIVSRTIDADSVCDALVFRDYPEALEYAKAMSKTGYVYVMGGKQIYELADQHGVDEYLITHFNATYQGDVVYNPPLKGYYKSSSWIELENGLPVEYAHYVKKHPICETFQPELPVWDFKRRLIEAQKKYSIDLECILKWGRGDSPLIKHTSENPFTDIDLLKPDVNFMNNFYNVFSKEYGTTILLNSFGVKRNATKKRGVTKRVLLSELINDHLDNLSPEAIDIMLNVGKLDLKRTVPDN